MARSHQNSSEQGGNGSNGSHPLRIQAPGAGKVNQWGMAKWRGAPKHFQVVLGAKRSPESCSLLLFPKQQPRAAVLWGQAQTQKWDTGDWEKHELSLEPLSLHVCAYGVWKGGGTTGLWLQ